MDRRIGTALTAGIMMVSALVVSAAPTAHAAPSANARGHANEHALCAAPTSAEPSCLVHVATQSGSSTPVTNTTPVGLTPSQFHTAYNVPTTASGDVTIAIIVGYDNPNVKADLDVYNSTFGLAKFPACSSSITRACFQKVMQKRSIAMDPIWALEADSDVQVAHMMCQNCKILLVEGTTNAWSSLLWGVDTAVSMGAKVVNNSFAGLESSATSAFDAHYNHPGTAFTAGSGDWGYDVRYPASSPYVTGVGGTTLNIDSLGSWVSETVWNKTGSGCSAFEPKPSFQVDTGCRSRTVADVAADADPATGAAIYDSIGYNNTSGWYQEGGTSLSAPLIAGVYALGGLPTQLQQNSLPYLHGNASNLHDVTIGSTSTCGSYLCEAATGYDAPTGLGTPNGLNAFR